MSGEPENDATQEKQTREIRIQLFTRQAKHAIGETPITVPIRLRRVHLSQMVNSLLGYDPAIPFDFLLNGEFLRTSLEAYLDKNSRISLEELLRIEYVEALIPPTESLDIKEDDWISSIKGTPSGEHYLVGTYNHTAKIWTKTGEQLVTLTGHENYVSAVSWIDRDDQTAPLCVTSSQDETVRIWSLSEDFTSSNCAFVCRGHTAGVASIAIQPTGRLLASGAWDKNICIWNTEPSDEDIAEVQSAPKKQKSNAPVTATKSALTTLHGSGGAVLALTWADRGTVLSAGMDHCIRVWDIQAAKNTFTLASSKATKQISLNQESKLLAGADSDGCIRLYDMRAGHDCIIAATILAHTTTTTSVCWAPHVVHQLVSGAQDKEGQNAKIWDIRSTKSPLFGLKGLPQSVLAVDWAHASAIACGGADNILKIHAMRGAE